MSTETMIGHILGKLVTEGANTTALSWHRERLKHLPPHFVAEEYRERCGQFGWNVCYMWQRASFRGITPEGTGCCGYNLTKENQ